TEDTAFAAATTTTTSTPPRKRKRFSKSTTTTTTTIKPEPSSPQSLPPSTTAPTPKKPRRAPAKKTALPSRETKTEPPPNWQTVYDLCATQRTRVLAPVDTMGCESLAEPTRAPQDQRLQTLIALMLSSQTKDTVTAAAIKTLQARLPGGLTLASLRAVEQDVLNGLIGKVGFHNNKARYIKQTAEILASDFAADIPDSVEGLISLPGVGPKMAYLCMSSAWGRDEGIGVDVHVHRITNLWGWHKTRSPEETRLMLQSWLPREKWHEINHLLVGFGQTVCLPVGRKCGECDVGAKGLC
ncbi:DNA glycosylase, partial [Saccharata proteae CBS 121410]